MNSATINTIQAMLQELTPEQLADIESAVATHYRTNIVQRIQWFETSDLLQVGAFIGTGNAAFVFENAIACSTVVEAPEAFEDATQRSWEQNEPQSAELEPYDDEAHEKFFQFMSYGKTVEANSTS